MLEVKGLKWRHQSVPDHQLHLLISYILNLIKIDKVIELLFNISNNRKYKDYVYRKMLVQEYLKK